MQRLAYLPAARRDLDGILRYIARTSRSPVVATAFVESLRVKCSELASLPGTLGRPRTEIRPDLRSYAFKGYVIFFRYLPGVFQIVNVIEGHRDIEALFED